jgi:lysyl-tRNA synthetase class 2
MKKNNNIEQDENRLIEARKANLESLRSLGINPYPSKFHKTHTTLEARGILEDLEITHRDDNLKTELVIVAGRVMAYRDQGKIIFVDLKDGYGSIQIAFRSDLLTYKLFEILKFIDIGDFIGVEGIVFRTRRGEPTIEAKKIDVLCKSIRPLPDKWSGLQDIEKRYRQRYLDFISNDSSKEVALVKPKIIASIRKFLEIKNFVEVETPILVSVAAGAMAKPFITKHNALDRVLYLRIATELNLKKLIVGGVDKVFELGRIFRNEGIDHLHNPEFTTLESYEAYSDYNDVMKMVEEMVAAVSEDVNGSKIVNIGDEVIDLTPPWERLNLRDTIKKYSGIDYLKCRSPQELEKEMQSRGIHVEQGSNWGRMLDKVISYSVEPNLRQPCFLIDYPVEMSPLAKKGEGEDNIVERFEAFVCGGELANAFTELNDPIDQRKRFEDQEKLRKESGDDELDRLEEDFLIAIEHGMPPTGGLGLGIDRLAMIISGAKSIRDVLIFPQLKTLQDNNDD